MAAQVALNIVPFVGPVVSQALSLYASERRSQQLDELVVEIQQRLANLAAEKIDRSYVETAEFQEAAFRAFDAGRTRTTPINGN
jgi:hypothetical protein